MARLNLTESNFYLKKCLRRLLSTFLLAGRDLKEVKQSTGFIGRRLFESIICQEKYGGMNGSLIRHHHHAVSQILYALLVTIQQNAKICSFSISLVNKRFKYCYYYFTGIGNSFGKCGEFCSTGTAVHSS